MLDQISGYYQMWYFYAILHLWTQQTKPEALCHCHTIWQVQIQTSPDGTQMHLWLCSASHGGSIMWSQGHQSISWQFWCLLVTWEHYILLLDKILFQLEANGFAVNPRKCKGAIQETDWLSYWLTSTGLKPWCKKMMLFCKCKNPKTSHKCKVSLVLSITTKACGLNEHIFLHLSPANWKKDFTLDPWYGPCFQTPNTWTLSWHKTASFNIQITTNPLTFTLMPPVIKWELILSKMTNLWPSGPTNWMIPKCVILLVTKNSFPLSWF